MRRENLFFICSKKANDEVEINSAPVPRDTEAGSPVHTELLTQSLPSTASLMPLPHLNNICPWICIRFVCCEISKLDSFQNKCTAHATHENETLRKHVRSLLKLGSGFFHFVDKRKKECDDFLLLIKFFYCEKDSTVE